MSVISDDDDERPKGGLKKLHALVIGNAAYRGGKGEFEKIPGTILDADNMAASLISIGYTVVKKINLTKAELKVCTCTYYCAAPFFSFFRIPHTCYADRFELLC